MTHQADIAAHYTSGSLMARLRAALLEDGCDPDHPALDELTPYDQFHGRGFEATKEIADALEVSSQDHLLDIGSGIGGPARYMTTRFGCQVTGIDLTEEFCAVAKELTAALDLSGRVGFEQGDALAMPFGDATFDGAYSMNVSMNISDKTTFYGEIRRVLKPGGWLMLSEVAQGPNGMVEFPTPWAETAQSSFLVTPDKTRAGLEACGFEVVSLHDTLSQSKDYGARSRAAVEHGERPLHRAVQLIHGDIAGEAMANSSSGTAEGRTIPIEVLCKVPG